VGAEGGQFRFRIDGVFTITGRGTAIMGFIEQGTVRVGDTLQIVRADGTAGPDFTCRGVESVRQADWRPGDPVPIGLLAGNLLRHEVGQGDYLIGTIPADEVVLG
jgi:translation elongation factor EF-Tu-like GTPase